MIRFDRDDLLGRVTMAAPTGESVRVLDVELPLFVVAKDVPAAKLARKNKSKKPSEKEKESEEIEGALVPLEDSMSVTLAEGLGTKCAGYIKAVFIWTPDKKKKKKKKGGEAASKIELDLQLPDKIAKTANIDEMSHPQQLHICSRDTLTGGLRVTASGAIGIPDDADGHAPHAVCV